MVKLRKKEELPVDFQMAPMIDMVFLLLVFFMCVSTLSVGEQIALKLPLSEQDMEERENSLVVNIGTDGRFIADGRLTTLEQWVLYVRNIPPEGKQQILIRADAQVPYLQIRKLLDACAEAGIQHVRYAVLEKAGS